jgi:hypothetical protein
MIPGRICFIEDLKTNYMPICGGAGLAIFQGLWNIPVSIRE